MSAASRAAVYFAICCRIAFVAAWAFFALSPDTAHDRVKAIAKHKPNTRALAGVALFGFLTVDVPRDAKLIGECAKTVGPESSLKGHANGSVVRQRTKQALCLARVIQARHKAEAPWGLILSREGIGSQ